MRIECTRRRIYRDVQKNPLYESAKIFLTQKYGVALHTNEACEYGLYDPSRLTIYTMYLIYKEVNMKAGNVVQRYSRAPANCTRHTMGGLMKRIHEAQYGPQAMWMENLRRGPTIGAMMKGRITISEV